MSHSLLARLTSEEFSVALGFLLPPDALRARLRKLPLVLDIRNAVRQQRIGEKDIREFAAGVSTRFRPGFLHPDEAGIAALAVALELCDNTFAEQYLHDLAKLKRRELPTAIRVARLCLTARMARPTTQTKKFRYPLPPDRVPAVPSASRPRRETPTTPQSQQARYDAAGSR